MARPTALSSMCRSCRRTYLHQSTRSITSNARNPGIKTANERWGNSWADNGASSSPPSSKAPESEGVVMDALRASLSRPIAGFSRNLKQEQTQHWQRNTDDAQEEQKVPGAEPYHLNVYSHRHNMHLTFTEPSRDPILTMSAGDIGLRKAQRSTYDAAYQLASYFFRKMAEKQWRTGGKKMANSPAKTIASLARPGQANGGPGIEVILRGYGPGREAFVKALLGAEGRQIKPLIARVTDATRLKFGGTRSHKVRRLG